MDRCPKPGKVFLSKIDEGTSNIGIVRNKMPVEIGAAKE